MTSKSEGTSHLQEKQISYATTLVGKNGGGSRRNSQCDDVIERDVSIVCVDVSGESGIVYLGSEANHAEDSEASVICDEMVVCKIVFEK